MSNKIQWKWNDATLFSLLATSLNEGTTTWADVFKEVRQYPQTYGDADVIGKGNPEKMENSLRQRMLISATTKWAKTAKQAGCEDVPKELTMLDCINMMRVQLKGKESARLAGSARERAAIDVNLDCV